MSPTGKLINGVTHRFPRVSGDEPFEFTVTWDKDKFSPREWG